MVSHGSEDVMGQCNHEEGDTYVVVHVRHALERGAESVLVRTVDNDVEVILFLKVRDLLAYNQLFAVWVAFGMGRHFSVININGICSSLGEISLEPSTRSLGVTVLRSSVVLEKKTAWRAWELNSEVTLALEVIATHPFQKLTISQRISRS